jgi:hypothetical protein
MSNLRLCASGNSDLRRSYQYRAQTIRDYRGARQMMWAFMVRIERLRQHNS